VVNFDPGAHPAESARLAASAEIAIVFAVRHETERYDSPDMSLPFGQDAPIKAVAAANPNTVVVLQTGSPIAMPWRDRVKSIVQAWFPGQGGAQAIAEALAGKINPSGRLPITFPADVAQTPFPALPGSDVVWTPKTREGDPTTANYREGAEVGYRWFAKDGFAKNGSIPLYAFGHGLSYTRFEHGGLTLRGGDTVTATFTVRNTGQRAGQWRIAEGAYTIALGRSAADLGAQGEVRLTGRSFGR